MQIGHDSFPCVLHPESIPYDGKSLIVHIKAARMSKKFFLATSYVLKPTCHSDFSSSIKGCRYTSIFIPGLLSPGIKAVRNMTSLLMHIFGGRLYGVKMTGQQE